MSTAPTNRIRNEYSEHDPHAGWQQQVERCTGAVTDAVRDHPLAATLAVFGVGFAVGTAIGSLLVDSDAHRRRHLATSLGRRMLDSVGDLVPESIQQRIRT